MAESSAQSPRAFRTEQRFSDPAAAPESQPDWPADATPTPPTGIPVAAGYYADPQAPVPGVAPTPMVPGGAPTPMVPGGAPTPMAPSVAPTPYPDLSTRTLLRRGRPAPSGGWRRWLHTITGGRLNLGESSRTIRRNDLVAQANRPLRGCYKIALLSLKGGVGKTTITATLGGTFASIRGDRVIAVDANPDRGTLSQKVPLETAATVRTLLRDVGKIDRYSDIRGYTSQGASRLEVLASESDPAISEAFSGQDYDRVLGVLERFYNLVLTDCGTGLIHSAMSSVLAQADSLIIVSTGSVDGARSASATLDWLDAHGYQDLVRRSVCVVNGVRSGAGKVDLQKVVDHFARRCRAVRLVPFDPHLDEGAEVDLQQLKPKTREALVELAAVVADGFPAGN
jgi:MinD-like ATPase involved in chromosome partitioning or flagellar assembly